MTVTQAPINTGVLRRGPPEGRGEGGRERADGGVTDTGEAVLGQGGWRAAVTSPTHWPQSADDSLMTAVYVYAAL